MNTKRIHGWIGGAGLSLVLLWALPVSAQTFSSGSTGALGAFNPTSNTQVVLPADGVLNYTTINIPSGVLVAFTPNAANTPVTMLATGDVTIAGTIFLNGTAGLNASSTLTVNAGSPGGPGGFPGGWGGMRGQTNNNSSNGQGPGGGFASPICCDAGGGTYGAPSGFVSLIPLLGGSGGGGVGGDSTNAGPSGGGGGGAIVIASTTKITVTGTISANGGDAGYSGTGKAGAGSGGAIRLVAPQITNTGTIGALNGTNFGQNLAGPGIIRLEAVTFGTVAPTTPTASTSNTLGPITANSTPALINLPTLTISSVGGVAAPASPTGSYSTADVSLPTGTTNPVPVMLTARNIPLGTAFTVNVIPQFAAVTSTSSTASTGSFANATATASVTLPSGVVSVLNAFASFTLTASLFPLIDGEELDRVMVAANYGEPSTVTLLTKSGKEIRVDQLSPEKQLLVAKGFEAMRTR